VSSDLRVKIEILASKIQVFAAGQGVRRGSSTRKKEREKKERKREERKVKVLKLKYGYCWELGVTSGKW
jgi:hypothetical protein